MGEKYFPFSKPEGVVLEKENKFFLETRRNMVTFRCWKKEKNKFFFVEIFFGGGRMKVGGLNLRMMENFSWGINM